MKTETLTALWNGEQYVCGAWSSVDGDEWITPDGRPVTGESFDAATITLSGGPRDGQTVG